MGQAGHHLDEAALSVRYVTEPLAHACTFSICTLLADDTKYARLLESFRQRGFNAENSEFIAADNRNGNLFDGFGWMRRLYPECNGRYIIFCHDDIELLEDGFDVLVTRLEQLAEHDPNWAVAGNAGARYREVRLVDGAATRPYSFCITDKFGTRRFKAPYVRVESLDENFLVMRRERFVGSSFDMSGFHFFATDLCLQAEVLGGSSYAINFHLRHHGTAHASPAFFAGRAQLQKKYGRYFPGRLLAPVTGPILLDAEQH